MGSWKYIKRLYLSEEFGYTVPIIPPFLGEFVHSTNLHSMEPKNDWPSQPVNPVDSWGT